MTSYNIGWAPEAEKFSTFIDLMHAVSRQPSFYTHNIFVSALKKIAVDCCQ